MDHFHLHNHTLFYLCYSAMDHFHLHSHALFYILTIQLWTTFTCTTMHCSISSLFSYQPLSLAQSCIVLYLHYSAIGHFHLHSHTLLYPHYSAIDHFHLHSHALFYILTIQLLTTFTCTAMHCSILTIQLSTTFTCTAMHCSISKILYLK